MNLDNYSTFKEFLLGELEDSIEDICNHSDTITLYDKFEKEIWEKLEETRESHGGKNIMEVIAQFNCAIGINSDITFKNALVWFIAEETAREIQEEQEQEQNQESEDE